MGEDVVGPRHEECNREGAHVVLGDPSHCVVEQGGAKELDVSRLPLEANDGCTRLLALLLRHVRRHEATRIHLVLGWGMGGGRGVSMAAGACVTTMTGSRESPSYAHHSGRRVPFGVLSATSGRNERGPLRRSCCRRGRAQARSWDAAWLQGRRPSPA